jgi:hypothetical protein
MSFMDQPMVLQKMLDDLKFFSACPKDTSSTNEATPRYYSPIGIPPYHIELREADGTYVY